MTFLLSYQNVLEYLVEQGLCKPTDHDKIQIKPISCKNFNLLVSFSNGRHLLVKQEPHNREGNTLGELHNEWRIQEFLQNFPELSPIRPLISEPIHFDPSCSIIVFNYLNDYCDLTDFYDQKEVFPTAIAAQLGASIATIHRTTLDRQEYKNFLASNGKEFLDKTPNLLYGLEGIGPEIFAMFCADGIEFFKLYQRHESIGQALAELNKAWQPCCLTHNDLKLSNVLVQLEWEQTLSNHQPEATNILRLIDWERFTWSDPAFDLATIIANYLTIWLSSLAVNRSIDVKTALRLAKIPLEVIQPSLVALTNAYFDYFPEILERSPDFLRRVIQFTGFILIEKIQTRIEYREIFGNTGVCMVQVAKRLLCNPDDSIPIVFGTTASELIGLSPIPA